MNTVTAELDYEGRRYTVTDDKWDDTKHDDIEEAVRWQWTEGNYGCDCNRFLFISYAYDDYPGEENEDGWFPCGEKVTLVKLTLDGKDITHALATPATPLPAPPPAPR